MSVSPPMRAVAGAVAVFAGALAVGALAACEGHRAQPSLAPDPAFTAADSLRMEGRSAQALERFVALRDSFAATGDTARLWRAQVWTGDALMRLGRRDSASAALDTALALAGDDPAREAQTRIVRSILLDRQGLLDSALAEARRALELAEAAGSASLQGNALNAIGRILSLSGRYREAQVAIERELTTKRDAPASARSVATAYNELGINLRHLGRLDEAVAAYREALALEGSAGTPLGRARVMNNLANVYVQTGELEAASALLLEALPITEEVGDQRALSFTLGGLGMVHIAAGNRVAARPFVARALETNRRAGLPYGEVVNLVNLGMLELGDGRAAAAREALLSAMRVADSLGYGRQRASSRTGLARAALALGDTSAARRFADDAIAIADSIGDPEAQIEAIEARGTVL
ncbi:MAG TPA: tetratricopeptide repeat protein, partial [Gemmatimonadaceae bacterium]